MNLHKRFSNYLLTEFVEEHMKILPFQQIINLTDHDLLLQLYSDANLNYAFFLYWIKRLKLSYADIFDLYNCFKIMKKYIQKRKNKMSFLQKYLCRDVCNIICQYVKDSKYQAEEIRTVCTSCYSNEIMEYSWFNSMYTIFEQKVEFSGLKYINLTYATAMIKIEDNMSDSDKANCFCLDCDVHEKWFNDICHLCHKKIECTKSPYAKRQRQFITGLIIKKLIVENRLVYDMTNKKTILLIQPLTFAWFKHTERF